jgi:hypothetical protein
MTVESRESIVRALHHMGVDVNAILFLKPTDEQLEISRLAYGNSEKNRNHS